MTAQQTTGPDRLVEGLAAEVSGFVAATVVDIATGEPVASLSRREDFDLGVASAHNAEMVRAKLRTIEALGLDAHLEDMLLTLDTQLHLIKLIPGGRFVYVAAERQSTSLALLRSAVNTYLASGTDADPQG